MMTRLLRHLLIGATAAGLLLVSPTAFAGKGNKSGDTEWKTIEPIGIKSFDDFFAPVKQMHGSLSTVEVELKTANTNLTTALGLPQGTPFADALADLNNKAQGKINVAMNGTVPKLSTSDAVPANVQQGIDAVNGLTASVGTSVTELQNIPQQAQQVVAEAQSLPAKFTSEAKDLGAKITEIPAMLKTLKNNVDATVQTPARATAAINELTGTLNVIATTFGGSYKPPAPGANTGNDNNNNAGNKGNNTGRPGTSSGETQTRTRPKGR